MTSEIMFSQEAFGILSGNSLEMRRIRMGSSVWHNFPDTRGGWWYGLGFSGLPDYIAPCAEAVTWQEERTGAGSWARAAAAIATTIIDLPDHVHPLEVEQWKPTISLVRTVQYFWKLATRGPHFYLTTGWNRIGNVIFRKGWCSPVDQTPPT